jgi:uncharacterized protein (TIGR03435 family)
MRAILLASLPLLTVIPIRAQGTESVPKFEVAAIRVNPGPYQRLVQYAASGNRLRLEGYRVGDLVLEAYNLKLYQIDNSKGSPFQDVYNISASAAENTTPTRDQFRQMLRQDEG